MSKLVGSRLHQQARLVHQGDNRLPEVVAVTPSKPRARSTDEGSLGARAMVSGCDLGSDIMAMLKTRQNRSEKWG
jgi:hypothetical protein